MLSKREATWHLVVLCRGSAHPPRVKAPCRKRQAIKPVFFQPRETSNFFLRITPRRRHVMRRLLLRGRPCGDNCQSHPRHSYAQCQQETEINECRLRSGFLFHKWSWWGHPAAASRREVSRFVDLLQEDFQTEVRVKVLVAKAPQTCQSFFVWNFFGPRFEP